MESNGTARDRENTMAPCGRPCSSLVRTDCFLDGFTFGTPVFHISYTFGAE
jgi:hypothetical protein